MLLRRARPTLRQARSAERVGGMPEWPKGSGCKPDGFAFAGSNPAPSTSATRSTLFLVTCARASGDSPQHLSGNSPQLLSGDSPRHLSGGVCPTAQRGTEPPAASRFARVGPGGYAARPHALVAQSAERFHGKEEVRGSIPRQGSRSPPGTAAAPTVPRPTGCCPSRRRSSGVEQATHNRCVGGSSPPAATDRARPSTSLPGGRRASRMNGMPL